MSATEQGLPTRTIRSRLQKQPMKPDELRKHMLATYFDLRRIMVWIAIPLPFVLVGLGLLLGVPIQGSMSAYYHSHPLLRDIFVGTLCAIGVALILYKGYSNWEDRLLNAAGCSAILVALIPMPWECGTECRPYTAHGIFAVLFFILIGGVCIFLADDTLPLVKDENRRLTYSRAYKILGALMVLIPIGIYGWFVYVVAAYPPQEAAEIRRTPHYGILAAEAAAIWIFGLYWIVKSKEIQETDAESLALCNELEQTGKVVRETAQPPSPELRGG